MTTEEQQPKPGPVEVVEVVAKKPVGMPWVEIAQDAEGWHWVMWSANGRPLCRNAVPLESKRVAIASIDGCVKNWACVSFVGRVV